MHRISIILIVLMTFLSSACRSEKHPAVENSNLIKKDSVEVNKLSSTDTIWIPISNGINLLRSKGNLNRIMVCFAGQGVTEKMCMNWSSRLILEDTNRLQIGALFSVKGPNEVYYKNRELQLNQLADDLLKLTKEISVEKKEIIIIAHSSGVFVAHEFFSVLFDNNKDKYKDLSDKISFFSLDGAIGKNQGIRLTDNSAKCLKHIYGVIAEDTISKIKSARAKDVVDLCSYFKANSTLITLNIMQPNCGANAKWYLHQALVNKVPHSKVQIDIYNDYLHFDMNHPINNDYLKYIR